MSDRPLLRMELVDSIAALQRHAVAFDALTARMDGTCLPVYHRYWIERGHALYLRPNASMFFVFAWRGRDLVGVAPLLRERRSLGIGALRSLEFWGQHSTARSLDGLCGDFIIPEPTDREAFLLAFREYLTGPARSEWDRIDLRRFCTISPNIDAFRARFPEARVEQEEMPGFLVRLPPTFDALLEGFGKNARRSLVRSRRRLEESGATYRFDRCDSIDPALLDEIATVHTGRQQELLAKGRLDRNALFSEPSVRRIVSDLLEGAAAAGRLRIHTLRIDTRLAAFGIVFANGADAVYWLIAFDAAYQQFSPSRLVFGETFKSEIEQFGTQRLNLMLGFTRMKSELSTSEYTSFRFELRNESSRRSRLKLALYEGAKRIGRLVRRPRRGPSPMTDESAVRDPARGA